MRRFLAIVLLLLSGAASADDSKVDQAEYVRLSSELRMLAKRSAWTGAERTYQACVRTRGTLSFEDHLRGAHAARSHGDVRKTRERLLAAIAVKEDRETIDWLWTLDRTYGQVDLAVDPGSRLTAHQSQFLPDKAKAVQFATDAVAETGTFAGYLPAGRYTVNGTEFEVVLSGLAKLDLRTQADKRKRRKKKR